MNDMTMPDLTTAAPFLRVEDLRVRFVSREATVRAVNGVSFDLRRGQVLCVIGESGSGKSVMMRSLLRLHPKRRTIIEGAMKVGEREIGALSEREMIRLRGSLISMVFQEPMTALDPLYTVGDQIAETVMRHEGVSHAQAMARALELLELVRVPSPERRLKAFPHELSGGLRQRVVIAMALSCRPSLLLADEPTTALDASVQIQILVLLRKLQRELGMSMIFVTHDLGVAGPREKRRAEYVGRRSLFTDSANDPNRRQLVGLAASDAAPLPTGAHAVETRDGRRRSIGFVTSSYWSPTLARPIALGLIERGRARMGEMLALHHLGRDLQATICDPCFLDLQGARLNA